MYITDITKQHLQLHWNSAKNNEIHFMGGDVATWCINMNFNPKKDSSAFKKQLCSIY